MPTMPSPACSPRSSSFSSSCSSSPLLRPVRLSLPTGAVLAVPVVRPIVRSQGAVGPAFRSSKQQQLGCHYRRSSSEEDSSEDDAHQLQQQQPLWLSQPQQAGLAPPHYAAVYAHIRHGAATQAQRTRDRQLQLQLHNARMQQQRMTEQQQHQQHQQPQQQHYSHYLQLQQQQQQPLLPSHQLASSSAKLLTPRASTSSTSSTSSTASTGSDLSAGSSSGSEAEDGGSSNSGKQEKRCSGHRSSPQHFRFSVDDIDKAMTEEELEDWFIDDSAANDSSSQQRHSADDSGDESSSSRSSQRSQLLLSAAQPSVSSPSASASFSSSCLRLKPALTIVCSSPPSPSASSIPVLPAAPTRAAPRRHQRPTQLPQTFTFSRSDLRRSESTASEELQVGHWKTFPKPSVAVCDVRMLRAVLREKEQSWRQQAADEQRPDDDDGSSRGEEKKESAAAEQIRKSGACRRLFVDRPSAAAVAPAPPVGPRQQRQPQVMWRRDPAAVSAQVAPVAFPPQAAHPVPAPAPNANSSVHRRSHTEQAHAAFFYHQQQMQQQQQQQQAVAASRGYQSSPVPVSRYHYQQAMQAEQSSPLFSPRHHKPNQGFRFQQQQRAAAHQHPQHPQHPQRPHLPPPHQQQQQQQQQYAPHQHMLASSYILPSHQPAYHLPSPLYPAHSPAYAYYGYTPYPAQPHDFFYHPNKPQSQQQQQQLQLGHNDAWLDQHRRMQQHQQQQQQQQHQPANGCAYSVHGHAASGSALPVSNPYTRACSAPQPTH